MTGWVWVWMTVLCGCLASAAGAMTASDYITAGRSEMSGGTIAGMRSAFDTFDAGLNDGGCADCRTSRELIFLHALTKTLMLFVDTNDIVVTDSLFEMAGEFGVILTGTTLDTLAAEYPVDANGCWHVPAGADLDRVRRTVYESALPQVDAIIAELGAITDSPPFVIYFTPDETGLQTALEVDYGDVLMLRGLLLACKALLPAQPPYDLKLDVDQAVLDRYLADGMICPGEVGDANVIALFGTADATSPSINRDLLEQYPHLLKVLPTPNDANDGAAGLARARQGWIEAINSVLDAIDYIRAEDEPPGADPQDDELLYFDPDTLQRVEPIYERLALLRDSLRNGTPADYTRETEIRYDIYDTNVVHVGELVLICDFTGADGKDGRLILDDGLRLEVDWVNIRATNAISVELNSETPWLQGWLEGSISADRTSITDATLDYWGDRSGMLTELSGLQADRTARTVSFDPTPLFGPAPLHPRDLLPQFDENNRVVPGTFGHGLGDDPALGGVTPGWYQEDWSELFKVPARVYRFWSPVNKRHFYTMATRERDKLVNEYADVWTFEGAAYPAYVTDCRAGLAPVHRFWSERFKAHFYTVKPSEHDKLIGAYAEVWAHEGVAFYAYPEGRQPPATMPVYRFWSDNLKTHFYTVSEAEKAKLIDRFSNIWRFEGIAWYVAR